MRKMFILLIFLSLNTHSYKLCIDPGHGGSDPGASGYWYTEKDANLDVALILRDSLIKWIDWLTSDSIKMTREEDVDISLSERVRIANDFNADIFISIHHNAYDGTVQGTETYCYTYASPEAFALRDSVHPYLVKAFGYPDRGTKTADFYVLKYTNMPAILGEASFIDCTLSTYGDESWKFFISKAHAESEAVAYAKGYCAYYGYSIGISEEYINVEILSPVDNTTWKANKKQIISFKAWCDTPECYEHNLTSAIIECRYLGFYSPFIDTIAEITNPNPSPSWTDTFSFTPKVTASPVYIVVRVFSDGHSNYDQVKINITGAWSVNILSPAENEEWTDVSECKVKYSTAGFYEYYVNFYLKDSLIATDFKIRPGIYEYPLNIPELFEWEGCLYLEVIQSKRRSYDGRYIKINTLLAKPTSLTAFPLSYSEVKLEWCDNSKKNTGYEIWYKPAGGEWQVDTVSDTTCAIVDNLDYHKEYYFKVRAIDDKGHASAFSDSVKCQPIYFYPVNDLKAHQIVERILKIEWDYDKLHNGFYIYGQRHLYPGEPADGDFFSAFVPANSFSYVTDSLSFGKWHITVKAIYFERDGDTIYSEPCTTSAKVVPNAPSNFVAVPLDEATVNLKWCDRSNYETGYLLEWFNREHGVREKIIFPANTSDTTIELLLGTNILKLCAFYATTETLYSAYESTSIYLKPNAPSNFIADAIDYDEIELKWKDNSKYGNKEFQLDNFFFRL